jgi:hypothetical protein
LGTVKAELADHGVVPTVQVVEERMMRLRVSMNEMGEHKDALPIEMIEKSEFVGEPF